MALKTLEKSASEPTTDDSTVTLELAMYTHYTWGGTTFDQGHAYKFKREDAISLLSERDHDRPIWRMFTPAKPKGTQRMPIVDSTEMTAVRSRLTLDEAEKRGFNSGKRIDVGTDEEISDILERTDDSSENVTV